MSLKTTAEHCLHMAGKCGRNERIQMSPFCNPDELWTKAMTTKAAGSCVLLPMGAHVAPVKLSCQKIKPESGIKKYVKQGRVSKLQQWEIYRAKDLVPPTNQSAF